MVQKMQPKWQTVNKMALTYSNGQKDAAGMANSLDHIQTAPSGADLSLHYLPRPVI